MNNIFKHIVLLIIISIILFIGSCELLEEDFNTPDYKQSVKIGVVGDVSVLREQVESMFFGAKLASEEINNKGGLTIDEEDYPIELIFKNSGGCPDQGIKVVDELIEEGVQIIVGPTFSSVAVEMAEKCVENNVLLMTYSATTPELTYMQDNNLVWRTCPSDYTFGTISAQYCKDTLQTQNAAILYRDDRFGIGLSEILRIMYIEFGGNITSAVSFPGDEIDLSTYSFDYEMNALLDEEPDVIFIVSFSSEISILINAIYNSDHYQNFENKPYIFVNDGNLPEEIILNVIPDILERTQGITSTNEGNENYITYKNNYIKRFGFAPSTYSEHAYDAVYLIAYAMQKSNSLDPNIFKNDLQSVSGMETLKKNLLEDAIPININEFDIGKRILMSGSFIDYEGASGPINFDEYGDPKPKIVIWGIQNSKYVELTIYD